MNDEKQTEQLHIRVPADLGARLRSSAKANHGSINREIVQRLYASFKEVAETA